MQKIIIALVAIFLGVGTATASAHHVPPVSKHKKDGAKASTYVLAQDVYPFIKSGKVNGRCGQSLAWDCQESSIESKPYEGTNGVSRTGSHSRDFKTRFKEFNVGTGISRWTTCVIRMYHFEWGELYGCWSGDWAYFNPVTDTWTPA